MVKKRVTKKKRVDMIRKIAKKLDMLVDLEEAYLSEWGEDLDKSQVTSLTDITKTPNPKDRRNHNRLQAIEEDLETEDEKLEVVAAKVKEIAQTDDNLLDDDFENDLDAELEISKRKRKAG